MTWDPSQYLKFAGPRLRPAADLLARVGADAPHQVYDLGCGAGNVTRLLAKRWPAASIVGVDDSSEMLLQAARDLPSVRFVRQSIADWQPELAADVIFSNAALHWLPDHAGLFTRLVESLAPGGVLAVQMPRNFAAPSHTSVADTVRAGPWRAALEPLLVPPPVSEPSFYHRLLSPLAGDLDIWETEYLHALRGADPVKEWVKGTWLARFLERLDESERPAFEADYAARLRRAYPPLADGTTLLPFRRLFIVLTRDTAGEELATA